MITLELLQSLYHVPLADVAKELGLSLTMLKKICRTFGIQRWPHRQIRSINKTMQELHEKHVAAANPEEAAEVHKQMVLLARKRMLVMRGASSGLQSALRNALFLTNPQDLFEDDEATLQPGKEVPGSAPNAAAVAAAAAAAAAAGMTPAPAHGASAQPMQQEAASAPQTHDSFQEQLLSAVAAGRRRQRALDAGLATVSDQHATQQQSRAELLAAAEQQLQQQQQQQQQQAGFGQHMYASAASLGQQQQQMAAGGGMYLAGGVQPMQMAMDTSSGPSYGCWPSDAGRSVAAAPAQLSSMDDSEMSEDLASIDFESAAPEPAPQPPQQLPAILQSGPGHAMLHQTYQYPVNYMAMGGAPAGMAGMSMGGAPVLPPELQEAFEMQQLRKVEQASEAHFRQYLLMYQQQGGHNEQQHQQMMYNRSSFAV